MDVQSLVQAESSDQQVNDVLEKFAVEMKLFEQEQQDAVPKSPTFNLRLHQEKQALLTPPGAALFIKPSHQYYTEDTLIWKTKDIEKSQLASITHSEVKELIKNGLVQHEYSKTCGRHVSRYLVHVLASTTDESLRYQAYNTLAYLVQTTHSPIFKLHIDFYLALQNLGADLSGLVDVNPTQRTMIPTPPAQPHNVLFMDTHLKGTIKLLLQILSMILGSNSSAPDQHKLSVTELDELITVIVALGLDPKVVESGLDHHISNCITHSLAAYPSQSKFQKRVPTLVEKMCLYFKYELHNVTYVCYHHILPSPRGHVLKAALAFLQLQMCLHAQNTSILKTVKLEDVSQLVLESKDYLQAECDGYILHFIIKLIDCCVYQLVLSTAEKKHLNQLTKLLNSKVSHIRENGDDLNLTLFRFYTSQVLDKWQRKMVTGD